MRGTWQTADDGGGGGGALLIAIVAIIAAAIAVPVVHAVIDLVKVVLIAAGS